MTTHHSLCIWNQCGAAAFRNGWFCAHHMNSVGDAPDLGASLRLAEEGIGLQNTVHLLLAALECVYGAGNYISCPGREHAMSNELASLIERNPKAGIAALLGSISAGLLAERNLGAVFASKVLEFGFRQHEGRDGVRDAG